MHWTEYQEKKRKRNTKSKVINSKTHDQQLTAKMNGH